MKQLLLRTLLLWAACWVGLQAIHAQADYEALDRYIEQAVTDFKLPGLAVGIVKDDKVVFVKGYGVDEVGKDRAVDRASVFGIASLSKAFTAAAIGMLVDDGWVKWSDKVTTHLPGFALHDPYVSSQMTVRDLLSHRSGLATFDGDLLWYETTYSRAEIIQRIRHRPLSQQFRSDFGYQNIMYLAAGELIPRVTGKSWDEFLQERIFTPLKMTSSNTSITAFTPDDKLAMPHLDRKPFPHQNYDNSGGAAAINSNVNDLTAWLRFWLNGGAVGTDTLLSPATINRIFHPSVSMLTGWFDERNGTHFKGYGLGWFLMDYQGRKVAHHGGGLPGYISKIALVPEENLGLVVLTNDMSGLPTALMYKIIDAHMGGSDRDWAADFLQFAKAGDKQDEQATEKRLAARAEGTQPSKPLIDYAGVYEDPMYGKASIVVDNGQLVFTMEPSKRLFNSAMMHWHYDTFHIQLKDAFLPDGLVTFELDANGKVTGFTIDLPNPDFHFHKLHFTR